MSKHFNFKSVVTIEGALTSQYPDGTEINEKGELHSIVVADVKAPKGNAMVKTPCAIMIVDKGNHVVLRTVPTNLLYQSIGEFVPVAF